MDYQNYLLQLNSGNIAPLTLQRGNGYIDENTNIDALLKLMENPIVAPRYRIYIVNDDDTIRSEIPLEDLLVGGNYNENYQNGQRCSLSLTLFNQTGKYMPNINNLWIGTKLRFDVGQEQQDGSIIWALKGIFVITSVQPSYSAELRTVSISAGDKFAELEGEVGTLSYTYEIPTGSRISSVVKELLGTERGNGTPIDSQPPYFYPSLANKLTQAKITKGAGDTIGSLILELANHLSAEVFYNAQGRLCFFPLDVVGNDEDKPILFNYIAEKGELNDLNFSLDYSSIVNKIILIGATVNGGVVRGEAVNDDPASPLCIQRIGSRPSVINESAIKTKLVAEENARYQLRKQLILKSTVSLNVPFTPVLGVNNLILVTDRFYNLIKQYFLIQSVSFGFDYSPTLSITVSNLANLPFVSTYKQPEEADLEEQTPTIEVRYPVIVELTNGSFSGPNYITKKGVNYIYLLPDNGFRLPYYSGESITVTGATYTYNPTSGIVTLANPTGPVLISGQCYDFWHYSVSASHGTISVQEGDPDPTNKIFPINGSLTFSLQSESNFFVPGDVKIVNASYTYTIDTISDKTRATLVLTNPTGPVTIDATCVSAYVVHVTGEVGESGIWPQYGIIVYDGKFPNLEDALVGQIETSGSSVDVTIKSSYISLMVLDVDGFTYSIPSSSETSIFYDSSVVIENETYLIFRVTGDASITVTAMGIPAAQPIPHLIIHGEVGESGIWPESGIEIYKGNAIAYADVPLLDPDPNNPSIITVPGTTKIYTDVVTQYFSLEIKGNPIPAPPTASPGWDEYTYALLTQLQVSNLVLRSEARYVLGYILVYEIIDPTQDAEVTVAADAEASHVDICVANWRGGGWPKGGIKVYDGDYSGANTENVLLRKIINFSESTVGVDIASGYFSLVADVYDMENVTENYSITLLVNQEGTSGNVRWITKGIKTISSTNRQSYDLYSLSGMATLRLDLYGIYDVTITGRMVSGISFRDMGIYAGNASLPMGTLTEENLSQRFLLDSYKAQTLTARVSTLPSQILLYIISKNPPGAVDALPLRVENQTAFITFNFNQRNSVSNIVIGEVIGTENS